MKIDAHHLFWRYSRKEFDWISDDMGVLRRNFLPEDLAPHLAAANIEGTVAVQARPAVGETHWLLELAEHHPFIKGVVGWVPLNDPHVEGLLDLLMENKALKGIRHVLQTEPSVFLETTGFNAGLRAVSSHKLVYDLLVFARQLPAVIALVDRHPELVFVVDHIAKPIITTSTPPPEWRADIRELARRERLFCKISGMPNVVRGTSWTPELLWPYFDVVLDAFGPDRLMFGSDWPLCLVASDYARWHEFVEGCVVDLNPDERANIMGGTASRVYRL
ncbi:MAG: amidohydrolase family protein [Opitutaceae bacterium]|nr:amidohydrolase family protein [Opitutaceae bacterium]